MFKKTVVLTRPPLRAKTRISPNKAAASEEANRTLGLYGEPLSEARTPLADCFNTLLVEDQGRDRIAGRVSHREHRKGPAIPSCKPEVADEISSRSGHPR
jgi:hypothetical protein